MMSRAQFNPAENYGGEWEYQPNHMFMGWHVYVRTA